MRSLLLGACLLASFLLAPTAHATYAPVSTCHAHAESSAGNAVTTSNIDCHLADLIVVSIQSYTGDSGTSGVSDSQSDAYSTAVTQAQSDCAGLLKIYFVHGSSFSSSMNFTATGSATFPAIQVQGFSGSASSPLDQTNSASSGTTFVNSIQPGSITPTQDNELVVTNVFVCGVRTWTVNDSFTITDQSTETANAEGGALAYLIQTTATAVDPTWSEGGANVTPAAAIASFKIPGAVVAVPTRARIGYGE